MLDPVPPPPPVSEPSPAPAERSASPYPAGASGLPRNVAAGLSLVLPLVGGIAALFLERRDAFVRFYAVQSIVLGMLLAMLVMVLALAEFIFSPIPWLGAYLVGAVQFVYGVFAFAWFMIWVFATVMAFMDREWAIPYVGRLARRRFSRGSK